MKATKSLEQMSLYEKRVFKMAINKIERSKGKEYAPNVHEIQSAVDTVVNELFESGATSHAVNDLVLFTDNTKDLAQYRDDIYKVYGDSPEQTQRLMWKELEKRAVSAYVKTFKVENSKHVINLSKDESHEFATLYMEAYDGWKLDHKPVTPLP